MYIDSSNGYSLNHTDFWRDEVGYFIARIGGSPIHYHNYVLPEASIDIYFKFLRQTPPRDKREAMLPRFRD